VSYRLYLKFLKNETRSNATVRAVAQRLCLVGSGFKCSHAINRSIEQSSNKEALQLAEVTVSVSVEGVKTWIGAM
jgi:hypothetical protein